MPTYEYECAKCKRTFERLQGFSEEPLKKCIFEGCNGKVHRLVSAGSGFIFKGNGFYETDYKKKVSGNGSSPFFAPSMNSVAPSAPTLTL